jgi:PAS domain S-box-containing protein
MVLKTGGASPLLLKKIKKTQAKIMTEKPTYEELEQRIQELGQAESKRKRAEEALRESEIKYRTILETTSEGCWILSPELETIEVNESFCKMLGYHRDEILGKTPFEFVDDENRKIFIGQTSKISTINHRSYEITLKKKNGENIHTFFNATTIREAGKVQSAFAFITDITERKRMVDELRKSEEKYRSMMDGMTDPAYICSHDFRIEYMNSAMIDKVGRDATGELCHKAIYDEDEKCFWCVFDQVRQGKHSIYEMKDPKTGRFYSINCSFVARSHAPASMLSIFRDITEIKMLQKEQIAAEAKLQQALKMESIGTLAGGIAHDFNNILSSIIGYTELSLDDVDRNTVLADNLREVYTAGLRAKDLVKQILTFARQADEEFKPVQVDNIVKEALKFLRSSVPTSIEIRQNIESDSLIMADPTQVYQIVMNLCTNAAQAMDEKGGVLSVGLTDVRHDAGFTKTDEDLNPGNYLKFSVSDTGSGIPPEVMKSIFDPYFTTKAPEEGTGMGLATVHGIVKNYGGEIMVESEVEKGSTFTVYLPITKKRTGAAPYRKEELPSGTERILFIDDEAPIAKMGGQTLERLGYTVSIRTSSIEALELFRSKPNDFDLVITDMTMPNMTGDKLASELMNIRSDIPVILCTGYSKKISDETALEIGINAFAYKPIIKLELAKTVRKVLDDQQQEQATGRILLIDDDSKIRKLFIQKLAGRGYEMIEACDGKGGLKLYHENRPDLVITDLVMPEKEGIETITELKRDFPKVKIIAISGGGRNVPDAYLHIAKNLGAERTFSKPIDWPELIKAVGELLK